MANPGAHVHVLVPVAQLQVVPVVLEVAELNSQQLAAEEKKNVVGCFRRRVVRGVCGGSNPGPARCRPVGEDEHHRQDRHGARLLGSVRGELGVAMLP